MLKIGRYMKPTCFIALALLFLCNVFLTATLYGQGCLKGVQIPQTDLVDSVQPSPYKLEKHVSENKLLDNIKLKLGRWDDRMLYKLYDQIFVGDKYGELSEKHQVCLATQTSLDRLFWLVHVIKNWSGPISVALFVDSDQELNKLLPYVVYLRKCYQAVRESVAFHLALPKNKIPKSINVDIDIINGWNCSNPEDVLKELIANRTDTTEKLYPQNHLRNLARKNCQSRHVFLTDVDIIPSKGLSEAFNQFFKNATCEKLCAYVIPTYEIDNSVQFPANKTEIVALAKKVLARPFHSKVFANNQLATNFAKWQVTKDEGKKVHISHPVTKNKFLYEPFYVAPDSAPPHDERFLGYGFTRNSQVYEMFAAGYEFYVLSPVFAIHWGFQTLKGRPKWRTLQSNRNYNLFQIFKKEISARYSKK